MSVKAVIFDMDGTVVADEMVYGGAFKEILEGMGAKDVPDYPQTGGIGVAENWPLLISKYKIETDRTVEELVAKTHKKYLDNINKISIKKGFLEFALVLKENGTQIALATSSVRDIADAVLKQLDLESFFDFVTAGDDVAHKKPSPEIFVLTADKMGVDPNECVVFEDSASGIEAARAAGMKTVGIYRDKKHKKTLNEVGMLVKDYTNFGLHMLNNLN